MTLWVVFLSLLGFPFQQDQRKTLFDLAQLGNYVVTAGRSIHVDTTCPCNMGRGEPKLQNVRAKFCCIYIHTKGRGERMATAGDWS